MHIVIIYVTVQSYACSITVVVVNCYLHGGSLLYTRINRLYFYLKSNDNYQSASMQFVISGCTESLLEKIYCDLLLLVYSTKQNEISLSGLVSMAFWRSTLSYRI